MFFALAGCAIPGNTVTNWDKPGSTAEQWKIDLADCEFQAKAHTDTLTNNGPAATDRYRELRDMCLKAKGYTMTSREFKASNSTLPGIFSFQ
jgi:hypothetical protein